MTKSTDIFGETDRLRAEVERLQRIIEDRDDILRRLDRLEDKMLGLKPELNRP